MHIQSSVHLLNTESQELTAMKYVCLGFIDENKFAQIPQAESQRMM